MHIWRTSICIKAIIDSHTKEPKLTQCSNGSDIGTVMTVETARPSNEDKLVRGKGMVNSKMSSKIE